jgi:hypothetical protein
VLAYLARYTHRVAISNQRLVRLEGEEVTFTWKDYARGQRLQEMTLSGEEFLRRFLLHVLPDRFVRILLWPAGQPSPRAIAGSLP